MNKHMYKSVFLMLFFSPNIMASNFDEDCEVSPYTLNSNGAQCVWIRNETEHEIMVTGFSPYADAESADLNDEYYTVTFPLTIGSGHVEPIAIIADRNWGAGVWEDVKFRAGISINGSDVEYGAYVYADVNAGVVNDFEFSVSESADWVETSDSEVVTFSTNPYTASFTDEGNMQAVYTYSSDTSDCP